MQDAEEPHWVAVYGSLMRGLGAVEHLGITERLRFVGPCVLEGELFDLGDWPGMRPGNGRVVAEIHALLDPDVLPLLDAFEDFDPAAPRGSLYLRERVPLVEPVGATAWTYVYNRIPDASARIPSGDWRRWRTEHQ
ncbi:MAG: gamma-glutamylcyclotransferase [bacterium]|nr:gamma-glutamylcyclotransferase [bacterium]